jgi:hypothetical protein
MPYVDFVVKNPVHWATQVMALLTRSRLETELSRKVERATTQLQVHSPLFCASFNSHQGWPILSVVLILASSSVPGTCGRVFFPKGIFSAANALLARLRDLHASELDV